MNFRLLAACSAAALVLARSSVSERPRCAHSSISLTRASPLVEAGSGQHGRSRPHACLRLCANRVSAALISPASITP